MAWFFVRNMPGSNGFPHRSVRSRLRQERYFRRLGVCVFLSFLLGSGDLHYENMIAHGEYPVPVDTEVLCTTAGGKKGPAENSSAESYSVLYSGILPDPARQTHVNVLNAGEGQKAAIKWPG